MDAVAETLAKSTARINLEILRNGLIAVTDETKINLMRTAVVTTSTTAGVGENFIFLAAKKVGYQSCDAITQDPLPFLVGNIRG